MRAISLARYFDHNATSPLRESGRRALERGLDDAWSNPSSPHAEGARCHALLDDARERMATIVGGAPERLAFNSGATEGNNAVMAYFREKTGSRGKVAISVAEHPSVLESAKIRFGQDLEQLPVDRNGVLSLDALSTLLGEAKPILVSVMAANNETGVLQPWREVQSLCDAAGVPFHCDVTQWLGRLPIEGLETCDLLTGSFHKLGGPKGVGFLRTSEEDSVRLLFGGEQEAGMRAGTENVPAILGALAALEESILEVADSSSRDLFEDRVRELIPDVRFPGADAKRLPNVSSFILPNFENLRWINRLDRLGFAASTGSACATGREGPSHVLAAMGHAPEEARRFVRVSGGWSNESQDWAALADAFGVAFEELRNEEGNFQVISL